MSSKISALTSVSSLTGAEQLPVVQSSTTKKATVDDLYNLFAQRTEHPGYISGNWYQPARGLLVAGAAIVTGEIHFLPFFVHANVTISTLGCRITTGASSGNLQLGIYAHNRTTGRPTGTALAATGSISTTSTGVVSGDITGADVALTPGVYWMGVMVDATAGSTVICQTISNTHAYAGWFIGSATQANISTSATNLALQPTVNTTYGTWLDVTAASWTEATSMSNAAVHFKVA